MCKCRLNSICNWIKILTMCSYLKCYFNFWLWSTLLHFSTSQKLNKYYVKEWKFKFIMYATKELGFRHKLKLSIPTSLQSDSENLWYKDKTIFVAKTQLQKVVIDYWKRNFEVFFNNFSFLLGHPEKPRQYHILFLYPTPGENHNWTRSLTSIF